MCTWVIAPTSRALVVRFINLVSWLKRTNTLESRERMKDIGRERFARGFKLLSLGDKCMVGGTDAFMLT